MRLSFFRIGFLCVITALLVFPYLVSAHAVISEVMWMGSDLSIQDEWVEITGLDSDTDLSGWKLTSVNTSGNEITIVQFATGSILPASHSWVIARYEASQSRLLNDPYITSTTMTLPNSKLLMRLRDPSGAVVDQADDGAGEPFAGSNPSGGAKASMERVNLRAAGSEKSSWSTSAAVFGWDEGVTIYGTPGSIDFVSSSSSSSSEYSSSSIGDQPYFNCTKSEHIFVSELMPDPEGTDAENEWIELQNPTSDVWTLQGWTLELEGSSKKVIPDLTIPPQSVALILTNTLGLSLNNNGATVILRDSDSSECDRVAYPKLPTAVSYGRAADDGQWKATCYPTPAEPNLSPVWNPDIGVESGSVLGTGKTKMNVVLTKVEGFTGTPQCTTDFGDGQKSQTCDPGWHTYGAPGSYTMTLTATNACSTTVTRTLEITVFSKSAIASSAVAVTSKAVSTATGRVPVILSAALPNPNGDDKGREWVELVNTANETVTTRGLRFVSGTKKSSTLGEEVFAARERKRYIVSLLGVSLGNTDTGIELQTEAGESLSRLSWGKAKEGAIYRYSSFGSVVTGKVVRVIDGDTFTALVDGPDAHEEDVRLLGVDAPETVHPTKGIQPLGMEAKNYLSALIENKKIELQFDTEERDMYGRALAYVSLFPSRESVQEMMIREGLVKVDEQYLYTKKSDYLSMQDEAKTREVGLWMKTTKKKSSSSSSKSSKSTVSITSVRTVAATNEYDSKPVYENVFSSPVSPEAGDLEYEMMREDDLYASLLEDQPAIVEALPSRSSLGISLPVLLGVLAGYTVFLSGMLVGGVFLGLKLKLLKF